MSAAEWLCRFLFLLAVNSRHQRKEYKQVAIYVCSSSTVLDSHTFDVMASVGLRGLEYFCSVTLFIHSLSLCIFYYLPCPTAKFFSLPAQCMKLSLCFSWYPWFIVLEKVEDRLPIYHSISSLILHCCFSLLDTFFQVEMSRSCCSLTE